jgi:DNA-binding transcriptional LysR family regulator
LNFTRAAEELYISQPAVTKHIHELEQHFKTTLIERNGSRKISLTPAGQLLLSYVDQLSVVFSELEFNMSELVKSHRGVLRIGASTTVAQYVIPPILARFRDRFNEVKVIMISGNTEQIETMLIEKQIDLGIIEGRSKQPEIHYQEFGDDELVLVSSTANRNMKKDTLTVVELKKIPLVLREHGSGSLEFIVHALKQQGIKLSDLQIEMQLGSTESIKSYLLNSNCLAFLSVHSIVKELKSGECRVIDVKGLTISRPFHSIQLHGQPLSLAELFLRFARQNKMA